MAGYLLSSTAHSPHEARNDEQHSPLNKRLHTDHIENSVVFRDPGIYGSGCSPSAGDLFFGEVCLVQSFNERHVLFALPISQRHSLLSSILPYLNERANIAYVRMLAIPNSLLWTRLHTILVMTGLTLQKLCIFGVFVYAGIYLNNATLFAFGLGIGLWFYKHSNREAKSFLATSNATLIEQRTFRVFLETIGRAVETVIKVFSFLGALVRMSDSNH